MINLAQRIENFSSLAQKIANLPKSKRSHLHERVYAENAWFSSSDVDFALEHISSHYLQDTLLHDWLSGYEFMTEKPQKVGVVMAGNIPAVGFHDFLSVLLAGHVLHAKLSSQDGVLMRFLADLLIEINPAWQSHIVWAERLNEAEAYIATGSDNSARYFSYYFANKPHIIRQNRNSVAVLQGDETVEEMESLAKDVFLYFGKGCRSVSKLLVPKGYDFVPLLDSWQSYSFLSDHHKYANNYGYQRSILLLNQTPHFDNGFLLLKEDIAQTSPISVLHYTFYDSPAHLQSVLEENKAKTQCIVSRELGHVPFGKSQLPTLTDFADGVDTMLFLSRLG